ncbi:cation transport ATPase [Parabacteroides sp. PF5-5]|uniref:hypothetical protein n=1 Tax=unclassified Parabacteroides TaxID=2649774 RepID=UPI002473AA71|nr:MULTISPECIES: hypothetical protein [unclassified Parabacteroides]MDH6305335.1 cation transport ATPase [Parabacteroides sp. PH5-39]MDH6316688.1 cation transport ATPase [Parabacteroides sp. PF5-13]MDH6320132.1 cation transport ATPase [Parabacteroides sp. PH5-13]MDH6323925.1 cation transport ATPase [Parabacteroides sp. PH5-8]MDH6327809.1 cation transport ATPase [Parabacteroides sp. PH5-41]
MEDRKITEKESLELISQMIRNTQNKLAENSGRPFLLFGYLSVAFAIVIWCLIHATADWRWGYLWFVLPAIAWPIVARIYNRMRNKTTYIDRVVKYIWILMGITIIIACGFTLIFHDMESLFFTSLLLGMCTALTGLVVKIKPVVIAGAIAMALSPVVLWMQGENRLLLLSLVFVLVFVIPGHILNHKSKNNA